MAKYNGVSAGGGGAGGGFDNVCHPINLDCAIGMPGWEY